jgi:hypothetical protein
MESLSRNPSANFGRSKSTLLTITSWEKTQGGETQNFDQSVVTFDHENPGFENPRTAVVLL